MKDILAKPEEPEILELLREHGLVDMVDIVAGAGFAAGDPGGAVGGDQGSTVTEQNVSQFTSVVGIQSLLAQFAHPQVRSDFLAHRFDWLNGPKLLNQLDELRWTLFPRWQGGTLEVASQLSARAAEHLHLLVNRSPREFDLSDDPTQRCLSYRDWFKLLDAIASDSYWQRVPPSKRCIHILPIVGAKPVTTAETSSKDKLKCELISDSSYSRDSPSVRPKTRRDPNSKYRTGCIGAIEEITIFSSSDSGGSSSELETGSSTSEHRGRRRQRRRVNRDNREVVTPPIFEVNGPVKLRDYLDTFEHYFDRKFNGTEYDKTQELSKFLSGQLLEVYKIRGGRKLSFKAMKEQLLNWYDKQKIGGRTYWRDQLKLVAPEREEKLDIYGMRLSEVVKQAYPKSMRECAKQLRKHFLESIPAEISTKIIDAERVLQAVPGAKSKRMTFTKMMEIAKGIQKQSVGTKQLMWANYQATHFRDNSPRSFQQQSTSSIQPQRRYQSRKFSNSRNFNHDNFNYRQQRSASASRVSEPTTPFVRKGCSYCKMGNHQLKDCWRASHSCLICGQDHHLEECPRYDKNIRRQRQQRQPEPTEERPLNE